MSSEYRLDFKIKTSDLKKVTKLFQEQDKNVQKVSNSFSKMEKLMTANIAAQGLMTRQIVVMGASISKSMVTPLLKVGSVMGEINRLSKFQVTTQQGGRRTLTMIRNQLEGLRGAVGDIYSIQQSENETLAEQTDQIRQQVTQTRLLGGLNRTQLISLQGTRKLMSSFAQKIAPVIARAKGGIMGMVTNFGLMEQRANAMNLPRPPHEQSRQEFERILGNSLPEAPSTARPALPYGEGVDMGGVNSRFMKGLSSMGAGIKNLGKTAGRVLKGGVGKMATVFKGMGGALKGLRNPLIAITGALFAMGMASPSLQAGAALVGFQLEQLSIVIGDALTPILKVLSGLLQGIIDFWNSLSPEHQKAIQDIIMVAAILGILAAAFMLLNIAMSPIGIIVGLIVAALFILFLAWEENWFGIKDLVMPIIDMIAGAIGGFAEWLGYLFDDPLGAIWDGFVWLFDQIVGFFASLPGMIVDFIMSLPEVIKELLLEVGKLIVKFFDYVARIVELYGEAIKNVVLASFARDTKEVLVQTKIMAQLTNDLKTGKINFAAGGIVGGAGAMPVIAHAGEMILNRRQQASLFNLLSGGGSTVNNNQRSQEFTINIDVGGIQDGDELGGTLSDDLIAGIRTKGMDF